MAGWRGSLAGELTKGSRSARRGGAGGARPWSERASRMTAQALTGPPRPARIDRFARNGLGTGERGTVITHRFARNGLGTGVVSKHRFARNVGVVARAVAAGVLAASGLLLTAGSALAKVPVPTSTTSVVNPGTGIAPPGSQQLTTIL